MRQGKAEEGATAVGIGNGGSAPLELTNRHQPEPSMMTEVVVSIVMDALRVTETSKYDEDRAKLRGSFEPKSIAEVS